MSSPIDPSPRPGDWRDVPTPEEAAEQVREPREAEVIRAVDDDRTASRQEATAAAQEEARRAIEENAAALEATEADRVRRRVDIGDVREAAQEVAENVNRLDRDIERTRKAADWDPPKI